MVRCISASENAFGGIAVLIYPSWQATFALLARRIGTVHRKVGDNEALVEGYRMTVLSTTKFPEAVESTG